MFSDTDYLQWELDREREQRQRLEDEQEQQRQERIIEHEEYWHNESRFAETWPEALQKQVLLMAIEAGYEKDEDFKYGSYFTDSIKGCERALEIWRGIEASKQDKIAKLKKQLEAIQEEIRLKTAKQLYEEGDSQGWKSIASSIENDTDLASWLYW